MLVNLRYPTEDCCSCCKTPLQKTYVRDITTGLVYHFPWCLETHIATTEYAIDDGVEHG